MTHPTSICRKCGRSVVWATMPSGKRAPFDPDFDPLYGTHILTMAGGRITAKRAANEVEEADARRTHFRTCARVQEAAYLKKRASR